MFFGCFDDSVYWTASKVAYPVGLIRIQPSRKKPDPESTVKKKSELDPEPTLFCPNTIHPLLYSFGIKVNKIIILQHFYTLCQYSIEINVLFYMGFQPWCSDGSDHISKTGSGSNLISKTGSGSETLFRLLNNVNIFMSVVCPWLKQFR